MSFYPVFVELDEKKVVVVGGGRVAFRKVLRFWNAVPKSIWPDGL